MARKFFISVGEASGDAHAASLMAELRKLEDGIEFVGLGGPRMAQSGCRCIADVTARSGMWLKHLVENFFHYLRLLKEAIRKIEAERPDAVILIDHPAFNVRLALHAKERGIPVIYYICPQTWAWGSWRIKKIARRVDKMLVILPFEKPFWEKFGVSVEYVGHPLFDRLSAEEAPMRREGGAPLIGLLPGSRMTSIQKLFPIMLQAADALRQAFPKARFRAVGTREEHVAWMKRFAGKSDLVEIAQEDPHDLMRAASVCMVGSGTASLEVACFRTPMVVLYRVIWFGKPVCAIFKSTAYISLVNLLAGRELVPELCMFSDNYQAVAEKTGELLRDESRWKACAEALDKLCREIGRPGASARAAQATLDYLRGQGRR